MLYQLTNIVKLRSENFLVPQHIQPQENFPKTNNLENILGVDKGILYFICINLYINIILYIHVILYMSDICFILLNLYN